MLIKDEVFMITWKYFVFLRVMIKWKRDVIGKFLLVLKTTKW